MSRIVAILMILAISGQVAAHGANSYAIIVRNESVMPESADLIVNDTLVLYNTAAWERTAGIDLDGDGSFEHSCTMSARNTTSNEDECQFPFWSNQSWVAGDYVVEVHQNGSFWKEISVELLPDNHSEPAASGPYVLLPDFDPMAENMAMIGEDGASFSKSKIRLPPGGNAYLYTSNAGNFTILSENGESLCDISGPAGSGCKIWFRASEWSIGEHELRISQPDESRSQSLIISIQTSGDEGTRAGMVQMISAAGVALCLLSFALLRSRRSLGKE
tara:strand:- start:2760 stop:3584 length:825 start_codon:yes stop_codon:yes gene_type:complete